MMKNQNTNYGLFERAMRRFSCIPLMPNSKKPLEKGWQKWCTKKRDLKYLPKDCNLGICVGPASNLMVIDIDEPSLFDSWAEHHGFDYKNEVLTVNTPSGGYHLYYRFSQAYYEWTSCKATISRMMHDYGFEMKLHRGYILAPGSIIDGNSYEVANRRGVGCKPPGWILRLGEYVPPRNVSKAHRKASTWQELAEMTKVSDILIGGNRNAGTYWFGCRLAEQSFEVHPNEVEAIAEWIHGVCGLPVAEAVKALKSGLKSERRMNHEG